MLPDWSMICLVSSLALSCSSSSFFLKRSLVKSISFSFLCSSSFLRFLRRMSERLSRCCWFSRTSFRWASLASRMRVSFCAISSTFRFWIFWAWCVCFSSSSLALRLSRSRSASVRSFNFILRLSCSKAFSSSRNWRSWTIFFSSYSSMIISSSCWTIWSTAEAETSSGSCSMALRLRLPWVPEAMPMPIYWLVSYWNCWTTLSWAGGGLAWNLPRLPWSTCCWTCWNSICFCCFSISCCCLICFFIAFSSFFLRRDCRSSR
mmetsp:Transcript_3370/g.5645  ORF Transcript_3370/g.5645 Transcript_3370/m.5645 type:complete len:262 (-) Transcript_3370:593-1378(-)